MIMFIIKCFAEPTKVDRFDNLAVQIVILVNGGCCAVIIAGEIADLVIGKSDGFNRRGTCGGELAGRELAGRPLNYKILFIRQRVIVF